MNKQPQKIDNKYELGKRIGRGRFGEVFRGRDNRLQREVAIKKLSIGSSDLDSPEDALKEAQLMASLHRSNILTLWDIVEQKDHIYLIMELARGGTLREELVRKGKLSESEALNITEQLGRGLDHAHSKGLIHRDLKPENIFINDNLYKIGDLGLSRLLLGSERADSTGTGTAAYCAPERFSPGYDKRSDWWSLGVIFYEMVAGKLPFQGEDNLQLMFSIVHDDYTLPARLSASAKKLITQLLQRKPEERLSSCAEIEGILASESGFSDQSETSRQSAPPKRAPAASPGGAPALHLPKSKTVKGIDFIFVPGGSFEMGDVWGDGYESEKPVHSVELDGFYLSKYPVTNQQYARFLSDWGKDRDKDGNKMIDEHRWGVKEENGQWKAQAGYENHPVIEVTWYGARQFAEWLGGRLPSEAEWEYAARSGGKKEKWAGTSEESEPDDYAWYDKNSDDHTHPVGQKKPNGLGLYDMSGNVWEWCQDWYDSDYYQKSPLNNPQGPSSSSFRVCRGGSWVDNAENCRSADRNRVWPSCSLNYIGFRLAASAE